jgi:metal-sulfur cluster biosynthetic enzyme
MTTVAEVLDALRGVRDPELDESLVELGFVTAVDVRAGGAVDVRLRLPTFFCAPNFTFLMVDDARRAVAALPGVGAASVVVEDHFTADEINAAVAGGAAFTEAFPGLADAELTDLRMLFQRKALLARQGRVCDALLALGRTPEAVAAMTLRDLPAGEDADRCRSLRRDLRLAPEPDAPAFVAGDGAPLTPEGLPRFLRVARLVALSLEGNSGLCRGLLQTRYDLPQPKEVAA